MVVLQPIKAGCPPRVPLSLKRGRARRALSLLGNNNTQANLQLAESLLTISAEEFAQKWNFDPIQGEPLPSGRFQWTPLTSVPSVTNDVTSTEPPKCNVVTSCDLSSSTSEVVNPAQDQSQEQKTCITLPAAVPSVSSPSSYEVNTGQSHDLDPEQDRKSLKTEAVNTESTSKIKDPCCSDNTTIHDNSNDMMQQGSEKDNNSTRRETAADSGIDSDDSVIDDTEMLVTVSPSAKTIDSQQSSKLRQPCITEFVRPKKLSAFKVPETLPTSPSYSKKRPASGLPEQLGQPPLKKVLLHLRA